MKDSTINFWKIAAITVCVLLVLIELIFISNQPWAGDYWEHKSALKELSLHPFHPSHPVISAQLPHAFYSPYLVAQAFAAQHLSLSVDQLLNASVLVNLLLFFVATFLLVELFFKPIQNKWKAFTLLLLAVLFFHGIDPPNFSSFFHFDTFLLVMSYPSTFSFIISVFAGYLFHLVLTKQLYQLKKITSLAAILILLWVVLLTHPVTYLFTISLFVYVFFNKYQLPFTIKNKKLFIDGLTAATLLFIPFIVAAAWSYYPFYSLITYVSPGNQFHADSRELYSSLYFKLYPFLIFIFLTTKAFFNYLKQEAALLVTVFFLTLFYVYGFFSTSFGFGRVISFITIYGCIFLLRYVLMELSIKKQQLIFAVMFFLSLPFIYSSVKETVSIILIIAKDYKHPAVVSKKRIGQAEMAHRAAFIKKYISTGDIVLADKSINFFIPSTGAKVIASHYPAYWITDNEERLHNIKLFFSSASLTERKAILEKYKVNYIILTQDTDHLRIQLQEFFDSSFRVSQNGITLLKVRKNSE